MKKLTALYFIVPIIGVICFSFFYTSVKAELHEREVQRKKQQEQEQLERAKRDVELRQEAYRIARADVDRRIKEIEERKKEEERKAAEIQAAKDSRDLVYRERERQNKRLTDLLDSRAVANDQLAAVKEQLKLQRIQSEYYGTAASEVSQNKRLYEQALARMDAAAAAAIKQAEALKAQAKKS
ncbi:lipopolysaccharide export LptBFGC system permease protein LptF [Ereboglobus sp. PH5-5]|uniref:hypothetical protein n=1 Tax=Ereboglobus sp. PH5-5 TaxID=2940529 RepID=UPI00240592E1|nr:hypothetical protein [Ereboglobus sp. PH5-5]MDF9834140.1 lipopolysaccharide export LptBFGC system permease protein LptF [Ereboglobus sp. PH5-5]